MSHNGNNYRYIKYMKQFGVILADPPWKYRNTGCQGTNLRYYPSMSIQDICDLPVSSFAAQDSVLLLWCTWPKLQEGLQVLESWGFHFVTGFPWIKITDCSPTLWNEIEIKVPYGIGFWARGCSEPMLIGKRGSVSPPVNGFIGLLSPNLFHSRKPDDIFEYAESLPGPYLELFARRKRPGWDSWGNEIESDISLLQF